MIDKIRNSGQTSISTESKKNTEPKLDTSGDQSVRQPSAEIKTDSVSLTGNAEQIRTLSQNLAAESAVDEAKVERLKLAIESGEYSANSEKIASKIIQIENLFEN